MMLRLPVYLMLFALHFLTAEYTLAQGCSDAGVCTSGASQTSYTDHQDTVPVPGKRVHLIRLTTSYGIGEQAVGIFQLVPELNLQLSEKLFLQVKMPFAATSGNLGSTSGIGDLTTAFTYNLPFENKTVWSFSAGAKIASGKSNKQSAGRSLPMPYQTSLGTYDFVAGISLKYKTWNFASGYQQVLVNANENGFLHSAWTDTLAKSYFESNQLLRGNDILLRVEKSFLKKKFRMNPGILGIYRLTADQAKTVSGERYKIAGSEGLTLNLTLGMRYHFSEKFNAGLIIGSPVIVREIRPDGLTRAFVGNVEFNYSFGKQ